MGLKSYYGTSRGNPHTAVIMGGEDGSRHTSVGHGKINLPTGCLCLNHRNEGEDVMIEENNSTPKRQRRKLPPCFRCGNHMHGKSGQYLEHEYDNFPRLFHCACAEEQLKEEPTMWKKGVKR